jgi:hypothetical protein
MKKSNKVPNLGPVIFRTKRGTTKELVSKLPKNLRTKVDKALKTSIKEINSHFASNGFDLDYYFLKEEFLANVIPTARELSDIFIMALGEKVSSAGIAFRHNEESIGKMVLSKMNAKNSQKVNGSRKNKRRK